MRIAYTFLLKILLDNVLSVRNIPHSFLFMIVSVGIPVPRSSHRYFLFVFCVHMLHVNLFQHYISGKNQHIDEGKLQF